MPLAFEKLTDLPVVLVTMDETYNPATDLPAWEDLIQLVASQASKQFLVIDMTRASLGLDDLISGASLARQMKPLYTNLRESIVITNSRLIELSIKGMNTATFGNIAMKAFPSLEAAMSYVRSVSSEPTGK